MILYDKDTVIIGIEEAYEETKTEINQDGAGFFNAITALETFKQKLDAKIENLDMVDLVDALVKKNHDYDVDFDYYDK